MFGSSRRLARFSLRYQLSCISTTSISTLAIGRNEKKPITQNIVAKKQQNKYHLRSYGVAITTNQHEESTILHERDTAQFCATIQAEIPLVVEDILEFYNEMGRSMVRTRYLDNLQFEERLIQSRFRSHKESSRAKQEERVSSKNGAGDNSTTATSLEDHFQVVAVEDLDDVSLSSKAIEAFPMDHTRLNDEPLSIIGNSEIKDQQLPDDRPLKLVDTAASLVSSYKTLSNEVTSSIILLRTISEQEWIEFDYPIEEELDELETDGNFDSVAEQDFSIEESDQIKEDFQRGQRLSTVSEIIKENPSEFGVDDYNIILARLAISTELLPDEIVMRLMDVCGQMKSRSLLDSTAFEIILLALGRRFSASRTAARFILEVTSDVEWSPKMMEAAADICEQRNDHDLASKLLEAMSSSCVRVPRRAYRSLLNYAKIDDRRDFALQVLEHALDNAESINDHSLDRTLASSLRWRNHNKYGKAIDNRSYYSDIIILLDRSSSTYRPGYVVWEALIDAISIGAKESPDRWKMVAQAFKFMRRERPDYYPGHRLLMHGLDASHALELAGLACELICRAMDNYNPRSQNGKSVRMVSVMDVSRAIDVCARAGENEYCRRILKSASKMRFQDASMSNLYHLVLNAAAQDGRVAEAERILISMQQSGIRPEIKSYCALMHAYAMSNDVSQATHLLEALVSDEDEHQLIHASIYDGYILACVRCDAWERIFSVFEKIKDGPHGAPSTVLAHGLLLASHRAGRLDGKEVIQELLDLDATFNEEATLVAAKILLPDLCNFSSLSIMSLSQNLKCVPSEDIKYRSLATELHRLLVIASVDTNRDVQTMPTIWSDVVANMLKFARMKETVVAQHRSTSMKS